LQRRGIHLRDEERRTVADDVVVVCAAPCVDEEQAIAVREPVLLRVVTAEFRAVVEEPWLQLHGESEWKWLGGANAIHGCGQQREEDEWSEFYGRG
jgi:hypothetical protein